MHDEPRGGVLTRQRVGEPPGVSRDKLTSTGLRRAGHARALQPTAPSHRGENANTPLSSPGGRPTHRNGLFGQWPRGYHTESQAAALRPTQPQGARILPAPKRRAVRGGILPARKREACGKLSSGRGGEIPEKKEPAGGDRESPSPSLASAQMPKGCSRRSRRCRRGRRRTTSGR